MSRRIYEVLLISVLFAVALAGCSDDNQAAGPAEAPEEASSEVRLGIELSATELEWIGQQVFRNECSAKTTCLVHWNEGEAFPSLGIGHFIWYPNGVEVRFVESFPALIRYMAERDAPLPRWLAKLDPFDAPWPDRAAFIAVSDSPRVAQLRAFLLDSRDLQAGFIVQRASDSLLRIVEAAPAEQRAQVRGELEALVSTSGGVYGVIDYVNFKGEGLSAAERYHGEGWGLLQVLMAMECDSRPALERFRAAASRVLTRRAENADNPIERERWLAGWLQRLETYREPDRNPSAPK